MVTRDHGDVGDAPSAPPPLQPPTNSARPSPAEQARTIAAANNAATLATLTSDGDPWASLVAYGLLNGAPVLCVSNLAEHGRNLAANPRASLSIVTASSDTDPLATGRITLAGRVTPPAADEDAARAAYLHAVPASRFYLEFSDFTLWVLRVERVRWVGGYGRMDSATGEQYLAAEPDPVTPAAAGAIAHLNADHADALATMAQGIRRLSGYRERGVHRHRPLRPRPTGAHAARGRLHPDRIPGAAEFRQPITLGHSRIGANLPPPPQRAIDFSLFSFFVFYSTEQRRINKL